MSSLNSIIQNLATEQPNSASRCIDKCSAEEALRIVNAEDAKVSAAVAAEIPRIARAVDAVCEALENGGRLFYVGAGSSGRLGVLDAVECVPTFNCPPDEIHAIIAGGPRAMLEPLETNEDNFDQGVEDLRANGFSTRDVLVGISSSGRTPYVLGAVQEAHRMGATTIGVVCNAPCDLATMVDIAITPRTGPEVILGSTRLKAGTATKMVLNMLSTVVMARRGFVFQNLMVNVQPSNSKLLVRARAIVAQLLNIEMERAAALLDQAGGSIRTAVVMEKLSLSRQQAEQRLSSAGGRLGRVLES